MIRGVISKLLERERELVQMRCVIFALTSTWGTLNMNLVIRESNGFKRSHITRGIRLAWNSLNFGNC